MRASEIMAAQNEDVDDAIRVLNDNEEQDAMNPKTNHDQQTTTKRLSVSFRHRRWSILLAVAASSCFAASVLFVKLASRTSPMIVMVGSSAIQLSIYLSLCIYHRVDFRGIPGERIFLLLRAIIGALAVCAIYYSVTLMPLADAATINYSFPAFVTFFGCLCLRERCGAFHVFAICGTLVGVILVTRPAILFGTQEDLSRDYALGSAVAFVACLCQALVIICLRKLQKTPAPLVTLWFAILNIVCGLVAAFTFCDLGFPPCGTMDGVYLVGCGLIYAAGQVLYTTAAKTVRAGPLSIVRTLEICLAFVFQVAIFRDYPTWHSWAGGAVILVFVVLVAMQLDQVSNNSSGKLSQLMKKINLST